jgi:hypothetical protein
MTGALAGATVGEAGIPLITDWPRSLPLLRTIAKSLYEK